MGRSKKLIQFYLTNMCNSGCKTCNIWKNKCRQELDIDVVKRTMMDFPDADYVLGGGEFTLYSKRLELLKWCNENNINYTVLTNAVSRKLVDSLFDSARIKSLTISCDGKTHDYVRGVLGNLSNIEYLVSKYRDKVDTIKLSYTLSKFNEAHIDSDMEYFKSLGFDKIYFCIAQNMDLLNATGDLTPSVESLKYLYETYGYMLYDKDYQLLGDIIRGVHKRCSSTNNVHTVYTEGDVVFCQSKMSHDVLGNINDTPLKEILEKENYKDFTCKYNDTCELVCQRRYDYEDRV